MGQIDQSSQRSEMRWESLALLSPGSSNLQIPSGTAEGSQNESDKAVVPLAGFWAVLLSSDGSD